MTDILLEIATAPTRTARIWKNKTVAWTDLLEKLRTTHRTPETYAEYLKATPARQAEIKDVGGFVGAHLAGGRRKNTSVVRRQLITLDADFAAPDLWETFTMLYGCAAAMYSTHKHSPAAPRLRLLVPLDRPVMADEYVPIARKLAEQLGIDQFDPSGFRPTQLMYWPSTAADGEYLFDHQPGQPLCADDILALYSDWKDSSEWPLTTSERDNPVRMAKKQGDPLEKPGLIGAFCRAYTIQEAISTFLADVYEPTDQEDRYSYLHGSTAGGLVLYEDKFAYSHHGTDPTGGQLCNAFDLVRIHRFGLQDEDSEKGTPVSKLPSFKAMQEFAAKDGAVRDLLAEEKLMSAQYDFAEDVTPEPAEDEDPEWRKGLEREPKTATLKSTINNALLILRNDPLLHGKVALDLFSRRETVMGDLPWRSRRKGGKDFSDSDDSALRHYLESCWGMTGKEKINDALNIVMQDNSFHPVRDYLDKLPKWDGTPRVDTLFIDYQGAEDNEYTRAVSRKMLVAAIARIKDPGVKFDNMLVLVGEQGTGKSTVLDKIGGKWFTDSFNFHMLKGDSKRGEEQIQGAWIVEIGELAGMAKADLESAKSFLSRREDRFRAAYGKRTGYHPRQCVFFGTTNNPEFLRDVTGNRRFWPVPTDVERATKNVFKDLHAGEIDQLWAEALLLYKQAEPLHLSSDLAATAARMQEAHTEADDRVGMILEYLETALPEGWKDYDLYRRRDFIHGHDELLEGGVEPRNMTCAAEIWLELFNGNIRDLNRNNTKFIAEILRNLKGWKPAKGTRKFAHCGYQRAYERVRKTVRK